MYECHLFNSAGVLLLLLIYACGYPSCLLSPHVNTLCGTFMVCLVLTPLFEARSVDRRNDQKTSYGTEDKYSLVQQICV